MAHGHFIMDKVNEDLVENTHIDLSTAQAKARLGMYIDTHHRACKAIDTQNSREAHCILPRQPVTPLDILNLRFFSRSAWGMPSMKKERENGQVIETPSGLDLPLIKGATAGDYTALLFKACGWDYHPFIGVKTYNEALKVAEKEDYDV